MGESGPRRTAIGSTAASEDAEEKLLRLGLPYDRGMQGAAVCDASSQTVLGIVLGEKAQDKLGCRAVSVGAVKLALFSCGVTVVPRLAPQLKGGSNVGMQAITPDGELGREQVSQWVFPALTAEVQKIEALDAVQAWRTAAGFHISPLTPIERHDDGTQYFSTLNGDLYCINPAEKRMLWKYDADGAVIYPPAVTEDKVFVVTSHLRLDVSHTSYSGDVVADAIVDLFGARTQTQMTVNRGRIHALDRRTGQFKWDFDSKLMGTPVVSGGKLYYGGLGAYGAIDCANGTKVWSKEDSKNKRKANWYCIQVMSNDVLFGVIVPVKLVGKGTRGDGLRFESDGDIKAVAIKPSSGEIVWQTKLTESRGLKQPLATLVLRDESDQSLYVVVGQKFFAVDPATGGLRWSFEQNKVPFSERVVVSDGVAFIGSDDHALYALNAKTGQEAWKFTDAHGPLLAPTVADGVVYVGSYDTHIYALDEKSGKRLWKFRTGGRIAGCPLVDGGKLYCASSEGNIWMMRLPHP